MSHRRAVLLMIAVTLMWSIAGVVTRHLDNASGFEVTFWRSLFNALALTLMLGWMRGPATLWRNLRTGGRALSARALAASSTAIDALPFSRSRIGFTSTSSSDATTPDSARSSHARWASR